MLDKETRALVVSALRGTAAQLPGALEARAHELTGEEAMIARACIADAATAFSDLAEALDEDRLVIVPRGARP